MKEEGRSEGALEWENIEIFAGEVERQNSSCPPDLLTRRQVTLVPLE